MATNNICGVSILRAGETMEQAVCDVCKDIRIGKILIQTNLQTGEPEVSKNHDLQIIISSMRLVNTISKVRGSVIKLYTK